MKEIGGSAASITKLLQDCFPDRKVSNTKLCNWLLLKHSFKYCSKCKEVKTLEDFHSNSSNRDYKGSQCIDCHYSQLLKYQPFISSKRRAAKLNATPKWADLEKIRTIYLNCPKGMVVDHIIPLQGDLVCGLHVENNLQYLTKSENSKKSNKFTVP